MNNRPSRPNVVFITADQMRADCLGCAGHPVVETPNLDGLAAAGMQFSQAYAACPSCIPARVAMLTGLSQRTHGRVGYQDGVPWTYQTTLPGELAKAGYHTQAVGKMHFHPPRSLLGFHNIALHDGYVHYSHNRETRSELIDDYDAWLKQRAGADADYAAHGLESNSWVARPWHLDENLHPTNWVVGESIRFLERRDPTKPFFLWMSFVRPHAPLDPPQVYFDQYIRQEISAPPVGDWADEITSGPCRDHINATIAHLDARAMHRARAAYYALITHIDHQIGRFREALHHHGLLGNTLLIFASDHGELLGDHTLFRKCLPYDGSARVPLIVSTPLHFDCGLKRGSVVDAPVELRDIMPTILDAAGVPVPSSVEGRSILPLCRGEKVEGWREYIHGEHAYGELSNQFLTDGRETYVWFSQSGREQLFDIRRDPQELHNLAGLPEFGERVARWRSILVKELAGREEEYSDGSKLVVGRQARVTLQNTTHC